MARLVIANIDYLVTVDRDRRIITDGALVLEGGRIRAVGKTRDIAFDWTLELLFPRDTAELRFGERHEVHHDEMVSRS